MHQGTFLHRDVKDSQKTFLFIDLFIVYTIQDILLKLGEATLGGQKKKSLVFVILFILFHPKFPLDGQCILIKSISLFDRLF